MAQLPLSNDAAVAADSGLAAAWAALREQFSYRVVSRRAWFLCSVTAIAIGFTNLLAMSLTESLLAVMAGCWLVAGGYRERLNAIVHNPVAVAALAMLALGSPGTKVFPWSMPYNSPCTEFNPIWSSSAL